MSADIRTETIILPDVAEPAEIPAKLRAFLVGVAIAAATITSCALAVMLHLS